MMPDLGRHADAVLAAYGATLALLAGLVLVSWLRSVRVRRALREVEARAGRAAA